VDTTLLAPGIGGARDRGVVDLAVLVARDHDQLDRAIAQLITAGSTVVERKSALEAVRVGLAAHADGEATVLHIALTHVAAPQELTSLIANVFAAHRTQESILRRMDHHAERNDWVCAAVRLRRSIAGHADQEQRTLIDSLRSGLPAHVYQRLASSYAAEKVRVLGMMHHGVATYGRPVIR
jgi:hypothetical protein